MKDVVPLRYGTAFKKAFGRPNVFNRFVKDVTGIPIEVEEVFQEYEYKEPFGSINVKYDLFAEDIKHRTIIEIQHIKESDFWDRFLYYHLLAIAEQVRSSSNYRITKEVYTIVVLTTIPKNKSIDFSMAVSYADPIIKDMDREGEIVTGYGHKIIFLNPKLVSEKTPANIRPWLELIQDSLDRKVDEKNYLDSIFQDIIQAIQSNNLSPDESARIKDDAAWEETKLDAREEGIKEGFEDGKIQGKLEGKLEGIQAILDIKFDSAGLDCMKQIASIQDLEKLQQVFLLVKSSQTLESFQQGLKEYC